MFGTWGGKNLLNIGCGAGEFASMASSLCADATGLDASAALIAITQACY
ncbi:methyltransferase domain-containing protein [Streptomyces atroolivaceus]